MVMRFMKHMNKDSKIYVAGHTGLAGSAIIRKLEQDGYRNLIFRNHNKLDLVDQEAVSNFFTSEKPEYVFFAAGKVGGILANDIYSAEYIYQNLMMTANVIHQAYVSGVKKLIFLGSSCIYPKHCPQPIKEEYLMTGSLEPTNSSYAVAKISGIEMCWAYNRQYGTNFIPLMPTNLYGINDNFDLKTSHVLPALIRKIHEAKETESDDVTLWGTGKPKREFLFVDDLADACVYMMSNTVNQKNDKPIYNIGMGKDISIQELAKLISEIVGFKGGIRYDQSKPDGTPQKLLDVTAINNLGWKANTSLVDGINKAYSWYKEKQFP